MLSFEMDAEKARIKAQFWRQFREFGHVDASALQGTAAGAAQAPDHALFAEIASELSAEMGMSDFELVDGLYRVPCADRLRRPAPVADADRVYPVGLFKRMCLTGEVGDFSGYYVPVVNGVKDEDGFLGTSAHEGIPEWASHVVWYSNNDRPSILTKLMATLPSEIFAQRAEAVRDLEKKAGVEYTFFLEASKALAKNYGDATGVDWPNVQLRAAETSFLEHGQPLDRIMEVLGDVSPGCISRSGRESMCFWVKRIELRHPSEPDENQPSPDA